MNSDNLDENQPAGFNEVTQPVAANDQTPIPVDQGDGIVDTNADTIATPVSPPAETPEGSEGATSQSKNRLVRWLLPLGLLLLLVIASASAVGGYFSGIDRRTSFESTQVAQKVSEQFQLGLQDLETKRYELARQRFEYVINLEPDYPGVTEKLAEVLLALNSTATPTPKATPTLTPTADLRSADQLFSQAQVLLADNKWSEAIDTLLKLRKDKPDYQAVKVDSMLYVALRNRGVDRILKDGDLEGGTYDLALAERFGPLDVEATNMRTWADLYVTGVSFWGLDWKEAVNYFGQLYALGPNLRDNTNMTATERYRQALIKYGDFLAASGDYCAAVEQYQIAASIGSDPSLEPTASWAEQICREGGKPGKGKKTPEPPPPEATPTIETPPAEATPTATPPGYP